MRSAPSRPPQTPSSALSNAVTGRSRADYTCYSIRLSKRKEEGKQKPEELDVVAVLIEAKMEGRNSNAVAQVICHAYQLYIDSILLFCSP